jgi:hypothetical protein
MQSPLQQQQQQQKLTKPKKKSHSKSRNNKIEFTQSQKLNPQKNIYFEQHPRIH